MDGKSRNRKSQEQKALDSQSKPSQRKLLPENYLKITVFGTILQSTLALTWQVNSPLFRSRDPSLLLLVAPQPSRYGVLTGIVVHTVTACATTMVIRYQ
ncbi:hypothetical protein RIF29_30208 [Crotalaria pallida]|uniref:Uncharacterized protein n=1 Tax=Crotalaria pallida TaxID=3830 RepID=A0AAN9HY48_CROPI